MAKDAPIAKYRANGHVYQKEKAPANEDREFRYRKDGTFCSRQAYSAGVGNYTRGMVEGKTVAKDGEWKDDIKVTVPTPDGLQRVYRWQASQMGSMANGSTAQKTITIDGETYTAEEIQESFDKAGTVDGQVVRY